MVMITLPLLSSRKLGIKKCVSQKLNFSVRYRRTELNFNFLILTFCPKGDCKPLKMSPGTFFVKHLLL